MEGGVEVGAEVAIEEGAKIGIEVRAEGGIGMGAGARIADAGIDDCAIV